MEYAGEFNGVELIRVEHCQTLKQFHYKNLIHILFSLDNFCQRSVVMVWASFE